MFLEGPAESSFNNIYLLVKTLNVCHDKHEDKNIDSVSCI